jgi:peptidoglycan hydrolase-like protein with peptidoglycan-binding domain
VRPASLLAVAVSAVVGAACGVAGGLLINDQPSYPDPLGVGVSLVNQSCQPRMSLLVLGTGDTQSAIAAAVSGAAGVDVRYLDIRGSCHTTWTRDGHTGPRYVAYQGPFKTGSACEQRMTQGIQGHLVTQLTASSTEPVQCLCYIPYTRMPELRPFDETSTSTTDTIFIRALQVLLAHIGLNPPDHVNGQYDARTQAAIEEFQRQHGPRANGVVTASTWNQLQKVGC